ncbi:hypothetical protein AAMO2058_000577300 [Amorphochlora amoebiformis]
MAPNSRGRFGLSLLWLLSLPNGARSSNTCIWSPERQLSRLPGYPEGTTATHYLTLEAAKRACDELSSCHGVTREVGHKRPYSIRASKGIQWSIQESSWLKICINDMPIHIKGARVNSLVTRGNHKIRLTHTRKHPAYLALLLGTQFHLIPHSIVTLGDTA